MKTIYLAGGCFWGTEHFLRQFDGVLDTVVGYANGNLPNPSYEKVYTDQTGHVECVKVTYDEKLISLATLCRLFFKSIDPLSLNRQGEDVGTRYRTGIYWTDDADKEVITEVYDEIQKRCSEPLAVEKTLLQCFYPAEEYHQDYLVKKPEGYCHLPLSLIMMAKKYQQSLLEME